MAQRDHQGCVALGAEDPTDQIGATFAVEHRLQHLDGTDWPLAPMRQPAFEIERQCFGVGATVRIRHVEGVVLEQAVEAVGQRIADRVAVSRHRMGDAIGRFDAQRDEFDVGIDAAGLEEAPRQRVVVGLVQLGVEQTGDLGLECGLDARPHRTVAGAFA